MKLDPEVTFGATSRCTKKSVNNLKHAAMMPDEYSSIISIVSFILVTVTVNLNNTAEKPTFARCKVQ
jgi:hypothetical protein